jgi:hypothetical protein
MALKELAFQATIDQLQFATISLAVPSVLRPIAGRAVRL